jgi:hypothetical protein
MRARLAAVAAALAALVLLWSVGSDATGGGRWRAVASRGHGYSLSLPIGWRRSQGRLVPKLLMPREVLSVANFRMAVGQGGNCGREPLAAIRRMRPGDALISVQEYRVSAALRARLTRSFPPRPAHLGTGALHRSLWSGVAGAPVLAATIPFSDGARAFDALVYLAGSPSAAAIGEINAILRRLRFPAVVDRPR